MSLNRRDTRYTDTVATAACALALAAALAGLALGGAHALALALGLAGCVMAGAVLAHELAQRMLLQPAERIEQMLATEQGSSDEHLPSLAPMALQRIAQHARAKQLALDAAYAQEQELRDVIATLEVQYLQQFDFTSAGILALDRHFRLVHSNPTVARVIGASPADMASLRGEDFIPMVFVDPDAVKALVAIASQTSETAAGDFELQGLDGESRWVHCLFCVQRTEGLPNSEVIEAVIYDITQRKTTEQAAEYRAEHDPLTGLNNRASIERNLARLIDSAGQAAGNVTVMFIDLDGFKKVNDTQGHAAGDLVLKACAERLSALVRRSDVVGRLGGDELVLLLPGLDAEHEAVPKLASRVLERIRLPIDTGPGQQAHVGASIGIASYPRHGTSRESVLHAADEAMYLVKRNGKNAFGLPPPSAQLAHAEAAAV